ncbi:MAG: hypothetical protein Q7R81_06420 [Candidatus Peregrinibacteria bacterium]|nr:hypothetical protein [Candidatus Peregrinibacteria bacterium]
MKMFFAESRLLHFSEAPPENPAEDRPDTPEDLQESGQTPQAPRMSRADEDVEKPKETPRERVQRKYEKLSKLAELCRKRAAILMEGRNRDGTATTRNEKQEEAKMKFSKAIEELNTMTQELEQKLMANEAETIQSIEKLLDTIQADMTEFSDWQKRMRAKTVTVREVVREDGGVYIDVQIPYKYYNLCSRYPLPSVRGEWIKNRRGVYIPGYESYATSQIWDNRLSAQKNQERGAHSWGRNWQLRLRPGASVTLRVVDSETGQPKEKSFTARQEKRSRTEGRFGVPKVAMPDFSKVPEKKPEEKKPEEKKKERKLLRPERLPEGELPKGQIIMPGEAITFDVPKDATEASIRAPEDIADQATFFEANKERAELGYPDVKFERNETGSTMTLRANPRALPGLYKIRAAGKEGRFLIRGPEGLLALSKEENASFFRMILAARNGKQGDFLIFKKEVNAVLERAKTSQDPRHKEQAAAIIEHITKYEKEPFDWDSAFKRRLIVKDGLIDFEKVEE